MFYDSASGLPTMAGSRAEYDDASKDRPRRRSLTWGRTPVDTYKSIVGLTANAAADHMHGLSQVLAEQVYFAPAILARSLVEACGILGWLLDPDADTKQRVARGCAFRLRGLRDAARNLDALPENTENADQVAEARTAARARVGAVISEAHALGVPVVKKDGAPAGLKEGLPDGTALITWALNHTELPHLDLLQSMWSGSVHSTYDTLTDALDHEAARDPTSGLRASTFVVPEKQRVVMAATAGLAFLEALTRLTVYFGWDPTELTMYLTHDLPTLQAMLAQALG